MSRISLRETYDNRSVIAQIAKVTDTAEDAAETVEQKAAEINDALTDVNAAVQAAEGAVTTANAASASAQQSAQTVAGYNTRLTTAEGEIDTLQSDLNSVTLRVQTAEGNIVTIQGRVTALETADGQNVKINRINDYAVGLTGNQDVDGTKTFLTTAYNKFAWLGKRPMTSRVATNEYNWKKAYTVTDNSSNGRCVSLLVTNSRQGPLLMTFLTQANNIFETKCYGSAETASRLKITVDGNRKILWVNCYTGTPRERIMINCLDGFNLVSLTEGTDDIGYMLDTTNNTMTGSNGDIITYSSITDVTL